MPEPRLTPSSSDRTAEASIPTINAGGVARPSIPEQYELLLAKLARAERDFDSDEMTGRSPQLEEASGIVFDLLYSLDFRAGGELVPRLAAVYGYLANQILVVSKSKDKTQLAVLRDMITTLRQSWSEAA